MTEMELMMTEGIMYNDSEIWLTTTVIWTHDDRG